MKNRMMVPLKIKLVLLSFIPFAAFIAFGVINMRTSLGELEIIDRMKLNADFIIKNTDFINLLQEERLKSEQYIKDLLPYEQVVTVVEKTDVTAQDFSDALSVSGLPAAVKYTGSSVLGSLNSLRKDIKTKAVDATISVTIGYSVIIDSLMQLTREAVRMETSGGIGKLFTSLNILQEAQEAAALFRGYGSYLFDERRAATVTEIMVILQSMHSLDLKLHSPGVVLIGESHDALLSLTTGAEWRIIETVFLDVLENGATGDYRTFEGEFITAADGILETVNSLIEKELTHLKEQLQTAEAKVRSFFQTILISILGTFLFILVLSVYFIKRVTAPISMVGSSLKAIAEGEGDLSIVVPQTSRDEIGDLARYFNLFTDSLNHLIGRINQEVVTLLNLSDDLTTQMEETASSQHQISTTLGSIERQVDVQNRQMELADETIGQLVRSLDDLTARIENQAAVVTESSASVEEMISNIRSISHSNKTAADFVGKLVAAASEGRLHMDGVVTEIRDVAVRSENLQEANDLISDIASQTGLLAMNAAIEAAHAGEHGKGFAVVADEIRKLAENASEQSHSILENLEAIMTVIKKVVDTSVKASERFETIHSMVHEVDRIEGEVENALEEQNTAGGEVLSALGEMNSLTTQVRDNAVMMKDKSRSVSEAMDALKGLSRQLQHGMMEILSGTRHIGEAVENVQTLSRENRGSIEHVATSISVFKLKD